MGNIFISIALNLQKHVHNVLHKTPPAEESEPLLAADTTSEQETKRYYRHGLWWLGFGLMSVGEAGNFFAYGYASPVLIAPLGTVALISNAIIQYLRHCHVFSDAPSLNIVHAASIVQVCLG